MWTRKTELEATYDWIRATPGPAPTWPGKGGSYPTSLVPESESLGIQSAKVFRDFRSSTPPLSATANIVAETTAGSKAWGTNEGCCEDRKKKERKWMGQWNEFFEFRGCAGGMILGCGCWRVFDSQRE